MSAFFTGAALAMGAFIVLALVQGARGPTVFDRVVSAALAAANGIVLLLIIGVLFERMDMFVDIAIAYALLAFLFPLALGKYFERFASDLDERGRQPGGEPAPTGATAEPGMRAPAGREAAPGADPEEAP